MDLLLGTVERKHSMVIVGFVVQLCWYYFADCESFSSEGDIRLVGGFVPFEGRVEVYHDGQWGTVCDDYWDDNDTAVVCRQLGFSVGGTALFQSTFGEGNGVIWMDNVQCDGSEYHLQNCAHRGWGLHNCDHTEDAGVACNPERDDVRLSYGGNLFEGRVEVYHKGEWGTVCDNDWNDADARVVCRQLGFATGGRSILRSFYGSTPTRRQFLKPHCSGHETSILHCSNNGWSDKICNGVEEVGVSCEEEDAMPPLFVVTIAVAFVFMLGVTAALVCLLICIRQMKLALTSKVDVRPNCIQMVRLL